jgi:thioredoxin 1
MGGTSMNKQLLYFNAEWCGPCKTLSPIMDEVRRQIPVQKINVDYTDPNIVQKYRVKNIPTVILIEDGQETRRFTGVKTFNQIIDFLNYG